MRELETRLKDGLVGRYSIKRETGRGGMATVFLARDLRHDRDVALKVLHPWIAEDVGGRRFEQEIRLAARLQHPHIVPVHDSGVLTGNGEGPDVLWFTMPFIEGESLRDRLRREGQLPIPDAVRITRQVCDALDYAHRHGVIHRDIKPENILLTGNHAMVSDFGIALAVGPETRGATDTLTAVGTTVGTVAYMSPEQSAAERTIDARSDQYSLACVLYEMLVGEPPFTGPTNQVVMQRRATEDARAMTVSRKGVPDNVERATATALSRLPADRFGTMADFSAALEIPVESPPRLPASRARRLTTVVAAMAVVGVLAFAGARALTRTVEAADAPMRLAVLPFQLIGDSADAYIADGMADEVSVKLTNVPGFELIARNSASQYRTPQKPLDEVAQELGVRFLLTGKLTWTRRGSEQLIIVRPQLVEVTQGAVVVRWSETFDGSFTDVFQVQSEIASRIAEKLKVAVTPEARAQLAEAPTTNHAAYGEFLRGEKAYLGSSGPTAQAEAVAHYENALALDSTFARAWARLSQVSSSIYARSSDPTAKATALSAAQRAIALDPKLQDGYLAMGNQFTLVHNDYAHAIEAYRAGLAINASHAELQGALGLALQGLGRYDEAIASMRRGLELDPRSLLFNRRLTRALTWAHRFDEAEEASRASLRLGPTDPSAIQYAVLLKLAKGDLEGARAITRAFPPGVDLPELLTYWATNFPISGWFLDHDQQDLIQRLPPRAYRQEINRWYVLAVFAFRRGDTASARLFADSIGRANGYRVLNPADPNARLDYAFWASLTGRRAEAIREAEAAVATRADDQYVGQQMRHNLIQVCIQAGDYERALDHLEKLVKLPYYVTPAWLRIDPSFDLIRNHPRFQAIINGR